MRVGIGSGNPEKRRGAESVLVEGPAISALTVATVSSTPA
jgi:hypothetical protein